ncbi:Arc family DNA-binding protein [Mesorhizobium sp. M1060]|uniref:Arc family DNA-binding protein n=1 Tax=unclassified Mesorhizobium TaxID=325217 RepID=UPI00067F15CF|nr:MULTISPECIES: Arc family DNA-binding protein [unclassified Mesorhizobium]WJI59316.1 Arc family DNA-binding protein [Mesorhizobium sp. C432A]
MAKKPGRGAEQFVVRLPEGMRDRIRDAADRNNRSMNAEVVATLEEKYPAPIEFDQNAFFETWISPIVEDDAADLRAHAKLIRAADEAAKKIHPNLGVWESAIGNKRVLLNFGIRDQSLLPPQMREVLLSVVMGKK